MCQPQTHAWYIQIALVRKVGSCVCACVCVCVCVSVCLSVCLSVCFTGINDNSFQRHTQYEYNILVITQVRGKAEDAGDN